VASVIANRCASRASCHSDFGNRPAATSRRWCCTKELFTAYGNPDPGETDGGIRHRAK